MSASIPVIPRASNNSIRKYIGIAMLTFLTTLPLTTHAASSSVSKWSGVVVYAGDSKVSSGVPVSKCHILTNEHAVRGEQRVTVKISGENYQADVVSIDTAHDLSLLKVATCPIDHYAKISKVQPIKGDTVTSIYYKSGIFINRIIQTSGKFLGYLDVVTVEDKNMFSMLIDDSHPRKGASGGGVATKNGLVSVIFGVANRNNKPQTFAVDYFSLTDFLTKNHIQN
ncbi:MAG: serine protease [Thiotrichaceae bacterium]